VFGSIVAVEWPSVFLWNQLGNRRFLFEDQGAPLDD